MNTVTEGAVGCVWLDGAFMEPSQARVSAFDHGFLYGDGVFETLRTYRGAPFRLDHHLVRLEAGLATLGIGPCLDRQVVAGLVHETLRRSGLEDAMVRVTVTRGVGHLGLDPRGCDHPTWMIAALPLRLPPDRIYSEGVEATVLGPRALGDSPPAFVKSTSYQRSVLGRRTLASRGVYEGLFTDEHGDLTEGTVANLFAVAAHGTLFTAPTNACLPGITRAEVLSIAVTLGMEVREGPVPQSLLTCCSEAFLTGSIAEIVPLVTLDGRPIGDGHPGKHTRALHRAYRDRIAGADPSV